VPPPQQKEYPQPEIMVTYMKHTLQLKKKTLEKNKNKKLNVEIWGLTHPYKTGL